MYSYIKENNYEIKNDFKIRFLNESLKNRKHFKTIRSKIYFDLIEAREKAENNEVVFIRIEQLYPFPVKHLGKVLKRYEKA